MQPLYLLTLTSQGESQAGVLECDRSLIAEHAHHRQVVLAESASKGVGRPEHSHTVVPEAHRRRNHLLGPYVIGKQRAEVWIGHHCIDDLTSAARIDPPDDAALCHRHPLGILVPHEQGELLTVGLGQEQQGLPAGDELPHDLQDLLDDSVLVRLDRADGGEARQRVQLGESSIKALRWLLHSHTPSLEPDELELRDQRGQFLHGLDGGCI